MGKEQYQGEHRRHFIGDLGWWILNLVGEGRLNEKEASGLIDGADNIADIAQELSLPAEQKNLLRRQRLSKVVSARWLAMTEAQRRVVSQRLSRALKKAWRNPESGFQTRNEGEKGENTKRVQSEKMRQYWKEIKRDKNS